MANSKHLRTPYFFLIALRSINKPHRVVVEREKRYDVHMQIKNDTKIYTCRSLQTKTAVPRGKWQQRGPKKKKTKKGTQAPCVPSAPPHSPLNSTKTPCSSSAPAAATWNKKKGPAAAVQRGGGWQ